MNSTGRNPGVHGIDAGNAGNQNYCSYFRVTFISEGSQGFSPRSCDRIMKGGGLEIFPERFDLGKFWHGNTLNEVNEVFLNFVSSGEGTW